MSYSFDGTNDFLTGAFTSTYTDPLTIACFLKVTDHPLAADCMVVLGVNAGSNNENYQLRTGATDNQWRLLVIDAAAATSGADVVATVDNTWTPLVGVVNTDAASAAPPSRVLYVANTSTFDDTSQNERLVGAVQQIRFGEGLAGGQDYAGLLAEVAVWNIALNTTQIGQYMSGTAASSIASANLVGYWPLSVENTTQANEGTDAGGDLSVTGATFNADHPTITTPSGSAPTLFVMRPNIRFL